jgi:hypothetical protein
MLVRANDLTQTCPPPIPPSKDIVGLGRGGVWGLAGLGGLGQWARRSGDGGMRAPMSRAKVHTELCTCCFGASMPREVNRRSAIIL